MTFSRKNWKIACAMVAVQMDYHNVGGAIDCWAKHSASKRGKWAKNNPMTRERIVKEYEWLCVRGE